MLKNTLNKLKRLMLLFLILLAISAYQGKYFGFQLNVAKQKGNKVEFTLSEIKFIIPLAQKMVENNGLTTIYNQDEIELGKVLNTSPYADEIHGFGGPVPVMIIINNKEEIQGVKLLKNCETESYIKKIEDEGFFNLWKGYSVQQAVNAHVDAVSGATETSSAILKSIKLRLTLFDHETVSSSSFSFSNLLTDISFIVVIVFGVVSFLYPSKLKNYRLALLLFSILVMGFWQGKMLSVGLFYSWAINGISISSKILLVVLIALSLALPVVTNKSFYCSYLCPFGACQELAGRIFPKKTTMPQKLKIFLAVLRIKIFAILVFLLILNISIDFSYIEPFSFFSIQSAPLVVIIFAIFFIVLSLFVDKPWCKYFCPTGQFLEIFRMK